MLYVRFRPLILVFLFLFFNTAAWVQEKKAPQNNDQLLSVGANRVTAALDITISELEKEITEKKGALDAATDRKKKRELASELRNLQSNLGAFQASKNIIYSLLKENEFPVIAVFANVGIDAGLKFFKFGPASSLGAGYQRGTGLFMTWTEDNINKFVVPKITGSSLQGGNLTLRDSIAFTKAMNPLSFQIFGSIGIIIPRSDRNGARKVIRREDLQGWYVGIAAEASTARIPILKNFRGGIGVYSLIDSVETKDSFSKYNLEAAKDRREKMSLALKNFLNGVSNSRENILKGNATLILVTPFMVGTSDGAWEGQFEALNLKLGY